MVKGTDNRKTVTVDAVMTVLRGSLPDAILSKMLAVFTNCDSSALCQAEGLVTNDIPPKNRYYFDAAIFLQPVSSLSTSDRSLFEGKWQRTLLAVKAIMTSLMSQRGVVGDGFSQMMKQRMEFKLSFHNIKHNIVRLQSTLENLENAARDKANAEKAAAKNSNYKKTISHSVKELVDDPSGRHSTICSRCTHLCHQYCGLEEISNKGDNAFMGCYAFNRASNCRICEGRCSYTEHYHGRKTLIESEKTVEEEIADIKAQYEAATKALGLSSKKITEVADLKRLVDLAIQDNLRNLSNQCAGIKKLCKGFNLAAELELVLGQLEAEKKKIQNLKARESAEAVIVAVRAMIDGGAGVSSG